MKKKTLKRMSPELSCITFIGKKPKLKDRPKCLQCDKSIPIHRIWQSRVDELQNGKIFEFGGWDYFCCRNCALSFANHQAEKLLKIEPFNKIK